MDSSPVRVIIRDGAVYVDVAEYTAIIVNDLMKAPPEMVASREEIIHALQIYCTNAQEGGERG